MRAAGGTHGGEATAGTPSPDGSLRGSLVGFGLAALAVALVRGLMALSRYDEFRLEEIYIGSFGLALREGLALDPSNLPIIVHLRGSVVFGGLVCALSYLTGPSILLLKTLAVGWSALTGGVLYLAVERGLRSGPGGERDSGGERGPGGELRVARWTAATAVALYAFLPPAFQMVDVLALGSHGDVPLFLFAGLATLLWRPGPLGLARAALFGLWVGAGSLFSLHFIVALPTFALVWLLRDRRCFARWSCAAFLACAALLAAPIRWLSPSATLVQKSFGEHFFPDGPAGVWEKLARTVPGDFSRAWLFADNGGALWTWVFGGALLVGLVLLVPRLRRLEPLALFALLYPLSVLGAHAISDFELNLVVTQAGMGSRYFMPVLPFLGLIVALGAWSRRAAAACRLLGRAAALAMLVAGGVGWLSLLAPGTAFAGPPMRGSSFPHFVHLSHGAGPKFAGRLAWSRRLDPDWEATRPLRYVSDPTTRNPDPLHPKARFFRALRSPEDFATALLATGKSGPEAGKYLAVELGMRVGVLAKSAPTLLAQVVQSAAEAEAQAQGEGETAARVPSAAFERGVGIGAAFVIFGEQALANQRRRQGRPERNVRAFDVLAAVTEGLPVATAEHVAEGTGYWLGFLHTPYNENFAQILARTQDELPESLAEPFFRGLAVGWRVRFLEPSWEAPSLAEVRIGQQLPERWRPLFEAGLESPADALAD